MSHCAAIWEVSSATGLLLCSYADVRTESIQGPAAVSLGYVLIVWRRARVYVCKGGGGDTQLSGKKVFHLLVWWSCCSSKRSQRESCQCRGDAVSPLGACKSQASSAWRHQLWVTAGLRYPLVKVNKASGNFSLDNTSNGAWRGEKHLAPVIWHLQSWVQNVDMRAGIWGPTVNVSKGVRAGCGNHLGGQQACWRTGGSIQNSAHLIFNCTGKQYPQCHLCVCRCVTSPLCSVGQLLLFVSTAEIHRLHLIFRPRDTDLMWLQL